MTRKIKSILMSGLILFYTVVPRSIQAEINTAAILASSGSPSCAEYRVTGICYWLLCTAFGCKVRTSTKVRHFIPDLVISSYNQEGQSPWAEMKSLNKSASGGAYRSPIQKYSQLTFKNADAIGHPGGAFLEMMKSTGYSCQGQTTPYMPYFLSGLDFLAWRHSMPEMFYPEAITPGLREVRGQGDLWGNVFPRSGFITQVHDYKAAALSVQRVADVVTRDAQIHIYIPVSAKPRDGYWPPKPVQEGDRRNHKWQMLSPVMENSCSIFPDGHSNSSYSHKLSQTENYSWTLWRPYSCCKRRGQTFLYSTGEE